MTKQFKNINNKKTAGSKGAISVIVALAVLAIILTIGLSASSTISGELALSGDASESIKAYYAAETGLEKAMYDNFRAGILLTTTCYFWTSIGDANYCLNISDDGSGNITAIQSIGEYGSVRRSVEISF